jgi:peptide methionine sulfoxide reductase MsrA
LNFWQIVNFLVSCGCFWRYVELFKNLKTRKRKQNTKEGSRSITQSGKYGLFAALAMHTDTVMLEFGVSKFSWGMGIK